MNRVFKVVIVGDAESGKTSYVRRLIRSDFPEGYIPTLGFEVYPYRVDETTTFDLWDSAGQERFGGLRDGYYLSADACIAFYDSKLSAGTTIDWIRDVQRVAGNIPTLVVANKAENPDYGKLIFDLNHIIRPSLSSGVRLHVLSVKENVNLQAPLLDLLQQLVV